MNLEPLGEKVAIGFHFNVTTLRDWYPSIPKLVFKLLMDKRAFLCTKVFFYLLWDVGRFPCLNRSQVRYAGSRTRGELLGKFADFVMVFEELEPKVASWLHRRLVKRSSDYVALTELVRCENYYSFLPTFVESRYLIVGRYFYHLQDESCAIVDQEFTKMLIDVGFESVSAGTIPPTTNDVRSTVTND